MERCISCGYEAPRASVFVDYCDACGKLIDPRASAIRMTVQVSGDHGSLGQTLTVCNNADCAQRAAAGTIFAAMNPPHDE
jgi:hypothetical protein